MAYTDQIQPASFRGVPFAVDVAQFDAGRRLALHEYPYKDKPWPEDVGRATRKFSIKGFLITDSLIYGGGDVIAQREALVGAAEAFGPGTLVHPTLGQLNVSCINVSTIERTDRGRYIEFTLNLYESGERVFPSTSSDTGGATLGFADLADASSVSDFMSRAVGDLKFGAQVVNQVVSTAVKWSTPALALVRDATNLSHLASILPGPFGRYFGGKNVGGLGLLGATGNLIYSTSVSVASLISAGTSARALVQSAVDDFSLLAGENEPNDFAISAQTVAGAVKDACIDPADAVRLLSQLALTPLTDPEDTSAPVGAAMADIQGACNDLYRRAAVVALARASATYQPSSYDDAVATRNRIAEALETEIEVAGDQGEDDSFQSLRALRFAVIQDLTERGATLAEMATFIEPSNLPAAVVALRLYRDPSRADELVTQVDPVHPLFMPVTFRALAS